MSTRYKRTSLRDVRTSPEMREVKELKANFQLLSKETSVGDSILKLQIRIIVQRNLILMEVRNALEN